MLTDKFSMLFSFSLLSICLESALKKFKGPGSCAAMAIGGLSNLSDLRVLPSGEWGAGKRLWPGRGGGQSLERQREREGGRSQGETVLRGV